MLRTLASRNEWILRRSLLNKASRDVARVLSSQAVRNLPLIRAASQTIVLQPKPLGAWSTNFVRAFADYPDHFKVLLPALSPTMQHGTIVSWEKKEGDKLNEGDLLAEIETDKATMGFETPEEGFLAKIVIPAGTKEVPIGKLVCIIVSDAGSVDAFKDFKDEAVGVAPSVAAPPPPSPPSPAIAPATAPLPPTTGPAAAVAAAAAAAAAPTPASAKPMTAVEQRGARIYASPMAKRLAQSQQLRLEGVGSGVHGSIKASDLAGKAAAKPAAAAVAPAPAPAPVAAPPMGGFIDIPVSNIRDVIAKRLVESKQQIPHYYVTVECQVDNLLKLRNRINKKLEKKGVKVSVNDFIIKATATACRKVPESNSAWMGNVIRQFDSVDVSVAVSTDRGLITPIIFSADRKGVVDISKEMKSLAEKARNNKLQPHEFQGGTVSVSNLGMFDVTHFSAIINPPQSCILAIGATSKKLVVDPENIKGFKEIDVMNVTLSSDHRTVDGAVAARWLQYFREFIEDPETMIL